MFVVLSSLCVCSFPAVSLWSRSQLDLIKRNLKSTVYECKYDRMYTASMWGLEWLNDRQMEITLPVFFALENNFSLQTSEQQVWHRSRLLAERLNGYERCFTHCAAVKIWSGLPLRELFISNKICFPRKLRWDGSWTLRHKSTSASIYATRPSLVLFCACEKVTGLTSHAASNQDLDKWKSWASEDWESTKSLVSTGLNPPAHRFVTVRLINGRQLKDPLLFTIPLWVISLRCTGGREFLSRCCRYLQTIVSAFEEICRPVKSAK